MDYAGWWATPEGRAELEKQLESFKRFEEACRARDPEGKFTFYD